MKLTIRQTVLWHSRWVARTTSTSARESTPSGLSPQAGETCGRTLPTSGETRPILNVENRGTTGCSDTALLTTVSTSGSSPAIADIVNDVDPWQCTTALSALGAGRRQHVPDGGRVVVRRRLVERPRHRVEVDGRAPVEQPHVPALVEQRVDERAGQRRPEQLGAHPGSVDDEDRPAGGRVPALDVDEGERAGRRVP